MTPHAAPRLHRLAVALGGVAVLASVLLPASAQAHNYLVSSMPTEGSTLTSLPDAFSITTNEDLLDLAGGGSGFALQVTDAQGLYYGDGCVTVAGATMTTPAALGAAGAYSVSWQAVSIDGHTVSGEYAFTWAPGPDAALSAGSPTVPVCGETASSPASPAESPTASSPVPTISAEPTEVATPSAPTAGASGTGDGADDATGGGTPGTSSRAPLVVGGAVLVAAAAVAAGTVMSRKRRGPRG